eukprot:COSAG01_NODE_8513_length_2759_cov_1.120301_1_plen_202_part_10
MLDVRDLFDAIYDQSAAVNGRRGDLSGGRGGGGGGAISVTGERIIGVAALRRGLVELSVAESVEQLPSVLEAGRRNRVTAGELSGWITRNTPRRLRPARLLARGDAEEAVGGGGGEGFHLSPRGEGYRSPRGSRRGISWHQPPGGAGVDGADASISEESEQERERLRMTGGRQRRSPYGRSRSRSPRTSPLASASSLSPSST